MTGWTILVPISLEPAAKTQRSDALHPTRQAKECEPRRTVCKTSTALSSGLRDCTLGDTESPPNGKCAPHCQQGVQAQRGQNHRVAQAGKELGLLRADLKLMHGWRFGYQVFHDVYFRPKQEDVLLEVAQRSVIICNY